MSSKIFVGNLNFQTTKEELTDVLAAAGQVVDVYIPTDRNTGRPRGFAFVEFSSPTEAADAIEKFNGHELAGRKLNVNAADDRPSRPSGPRFSEPPPSFGADAFGGRGRGFKNTGSRRGVRGRKRSLN